MPTPPGRIGAGFGACAIAVAALVAGCGTTTHTSSTAQTVHVNGKQAGDYVSETSATGVNFLVPTNVLSRQGTHSFEVVAHASQSNRVGGPNAPSRTSSWSIGPSSSAVFPWSARVEVLVSGSSGQRLNLTWEETCGGTHVGRHGLIGGAGGGGDRTLNSPAVVIVKLPRSTGADRLSVPLGTKLPTGKVGGPNNTCYLAATALTPTANHLKIDVIDY